ncbi:hypothetical protein CR62_19405 [Serratia grimesii]|nr:hypothetical protein CR62_19405 [Serratia grimesii]
MEGYYQLFNDAKAEIEAVSAGLKPTGEAAARIHALIDERDFAKQMFGFGYCITGDKPQLNNSKYSLLPAMKLMHWTQTSAPAEVKKYFDYNPMFALLKAYITTRISLTRKK